MVKLLPKEHGAYAQLSFPLATGLFLSGFSVAGVALAGAAIALFLANEPMAILMGVRGKRLQKGLAHEAQSRVVRLLAVGMVLGGLGIWTAGRRIWPELALPLGASVVLVLLILLGKQKTLPGELVVVTVFSSLVLPLAATGEGSGIRASLAASVWWISFTLGTLEVHAIKARIKPNLANQWTRWGSPLAAAAMVGLALWLALGQATPLLERWASNPVGATPVGFEPPVIMEIQRLLPASAAALLPPALAILVLSILKVHPRRLKRVGWTLVGVNSVALILLLQG